MEGKALTVTVTLEVAVGDFTELAVIVAVPVAPAALKVADPVETAASVVQAAPAQLQVAPALVESCITVAEKTICCPRSIDSAAFGVNARLTFGAEPVQLDS